MQTGPLTVQNLFVCPQYTTLQFFCSSQSTLMPLSLQPIMIFVDILQGLQGPPGVRGPMGSDGFNGSNVSIWKVYK